MMSTEAESQASQTVQDINCLARFLAAQDVVCTLSEPDTAQVVNTDERPHRSELTLLKTIVEADEPLQLRPTTIILLGSAMLHTVETVFAFLQSTWEYQSEQIGLRREFEPSSITTLVISGGIGHSTCDLHDAIRKHPRFDKRKVMRWIHSHDATTNRKRDIEECSEAELFEAIFYTYYDGKSVQTFWNRGKGLLVAIERRSMNCGENASETRRVLEDSGFAICINLGQLRGRKHNVTPVLFLGYDPDEPEEIMATGEEPIEDVVLVQDPTMSRRSHASFEKVYEDQVEAGRLRFWSWPTFVPVVTETTAVLKKGHDDTGVGDAARTIHWDTEDRNMLDVDADCLWRLSRFYGLLLGEIPRLRDDGNGYGPQGKGFITHVDVPSDVEGAWERLKHVLEHQR